MVLPGLSEVSRKLIIVGTALTVSVVAHFGVRAIYGRDRPDLAAWVSWDDGLWSYEKEYASGAVGPFAIGESRDSARAKLSTTKLFENDVAEIDKPSGNWRIALPAKGGGYVIHTVEFADERVSSVKVYYAVFAGL